MKDKPNSLLLEEVGGENGGRGCGQVQGGGLRKMSLQRQKLSLGMEACAKKQEVQGAIMGRRLQGKNHRFLQRVQLAASAKHA